MLGAVSESISGAIIDACCYGLASYIIVARQITHVYGDFLGVTSSASLFSGLGSPPDTASRKADPLDEFFR